MEPEKMMILLTVMILLTLIIILIGFYVAARFFKGAGGGLHELINRFPSPDIPEGHSFSGMTIQIGRIYYRNCVRIIVSQSGLFLSVSIPFPGISGGMMLIPWDAITIDGAERMYWKAATRLKVEGKKPVFITISDDIAHLLPLP